MTTEMMAPDDSAAGLSIWDKVRGTTGFAGGFFMIRCLPLFLRVAVMKGIRRIAPQAHDAQEIAHLAQAVRWASRLYPWRAACLEVSLGICLASLWMRRMPTWCVGATFKPLDPHAWVEVDGTPVGEPGYDPDTWRCKQLFAV